MRLSRQCGYNHGEEKLRHMNIRVLLENALIRITHIHKKEQAMFKARLLLKPMEIIKMTYIVPQAEEEINAR